MLAAQHGSRCGRRVSPGELVRTVSFEFVRRADAPCVAEVVLPRVSLGLGLQVRIARCSLRALKLTRCIQQSVMAPGLLVRTKSSGSFDALTQRVQPGLPSRGSYRDLCCGLVVARRVLCVY